MLSGVSFDYEAPENLTRIPLHILRAYARSKVPQATVPAFIGQDVSKEELAKFSSAIKMFNWFDVVEFLEARHTNSQYLTGYSALHQMESEDLLCLDDDYEVVQGDFAYVGADVGIKPYHKFEDEIQRQVEIFQRNKLAKELEAADEKNKVSEDHTKELESVKLVWGVEEERTMWRDRVVQFEKEGQSLMAEVSPKVKIETAKVKVVMGVPVVATKPVIVQYAQSVVEFPFYFMQIMAVTPLNPKVELNTSESYMEAVKYCIGVNRDDLMGMKQHIEKLLDLLVKQQIEFESNSLANYYTFIGYLFSDDKVTVSFATAISKILEKRWSTYAIFQKVPGTWSKNGVLWCKPKPLTTIHPSWLTDFAKYTQFALKCSAARGKGDVLSNKVYRLPHADARIQGILEDALSLSRVQDEMVIIVSSDTATLIRLGWAIYTNKIDCIKVFLPMQKGINEVLNNHLARKVDEGVVFEYTSTTVSNLQLKKSSTLSEQWSVIIDQHRNYFGMKPLRTAGKIVSHYFPEVVGVKYAMSSDPADGTILWIKTGEIGDVEGLPDQKMAHSVHRERYLRVSNMKTQFAASRAAYTDRPLIRCGPPVALSMELPELLADDEEVDEIVFEEALVDVRKPLTNKSVAPTRPLVVDPPAKGKWEKKKQLVTDEKPIEDSKVKRGDVEGPKSILKSAEVKISAEPVKTVSFNPNDLPSFDEDVPGQ